MKSALRIRPTGFRHVIRRADGVERHCPDARSQPGSRLPRHPADPGDHRQALSMPTVRSTNGVGNFNGGGLVFDRNMGFGTLDAEAAVKLAHHWTQQSTAANEDHLGGCSRCRRSSTPQPVAIGDDQQSGRRRLFDRLRRADAGNRRCRPQGPVDRAGFGERYEGADRAEPDHRRQQDLSRLHLLFRGELGETPFGTWTVNLTTRRRRTVSWCTPPRSTSTATPRATTTPTTSRRPTRRGRRGCRPLQRRRCQWRDRHAQLRRGRECCCSISAALPRAGSAGSRRRRQLRERDRRQRQRFIAGSDIANLLNGSFGNDTLAGRDGDDVVGERATTWLPGSRRRPLSGGAGSDIVDYAGAAGSRSISSSASGLAGRPATRCRSSNSGSAPMTTSSSASPATTAGRVFGGAGDVILAAAAATGSTAAPGGPDVWRRRQRLLRRR